jgi:hypothetical protein
MGTDAAPATTTADAGVGRWWPIGVVAGGGALLLTGGALGIVAELEEREIVDDYRQHDLDADELQRRYDTGRAYARWTNVTLGAGATLAGVGLAAWLLRADPGEPPSAVQRLLGDYGQYLALGTGGVALITGTTLGALAWKEERAFVESFRTRPGELRPLTRHQERGEAYALAANVLLAAGSILVTAGALDWWLLEPDAGPVGPPP